jgi:Tfp pilus assembly protein PilV
MDNHLPIANMKTHRACAAAHAPRFRKSQRGLTLLEAAISLAIFAYVVSALSMLTVSSMRSNSNAKRYTMASALAQGKIEDLRAAGYNALAPSGSPESLDSNGNAGGTVMYNRAWTVQNATPVADTKTVDVTVSWTDNQGSHSAVIKTIVANQ